MPRSLRLADLRDSLEQPRALQQSLISNHGAENAAAKAESHSDPIAAILCLKMGTTS
jgi:hypothetical protein